MARQVIPNFHGIGTPHDGVPQRTALLDRRRAVSPPARLHRRPPRRGRAPGHHLRRRNLSDLEIGLPGLQARGLEATFFILTGRLGQPHYLSAEHIHTLRDAGQRIGLHGRDHIDWRRADAATFAAETDGARATLAAVLGARSPRSASPSAPMTGASSPALMRAGSRRSIPATAGPPTGRGGCAHGPPSGRTGIRTASRPFSTTGARPCGGRA